MKSPANFQDAYLDKKAAKSQTSKINFVFLRISKE